jgi:hypothetical protein
MGRLTGVVVRSRSPQFRLFLLALLMGSRILAYEVNVTMDNSNPSIIYSPKDAWHTSTGGYANSYHATRGYDIQDNLPDSRSENTPFLEIVFTGTNSLTFIDMPCPPNHFPQGSAIYLFCIDPDGIPNAELNSTITNLTFTLNNVPLGSFVHTNHDRAQSTSKTSPVQLPIFTRTDLPETSHTLRAVVEPGSIFYFNYLSYTRTQTREHTTTELLHDSSAPSPTVLSS